MKIAYLVNQYPKTSHSFVRREIEALEAHGFVIERYSIRRVGEAIVDEKDQREAERTHVVLDAGGMGLLMAMAKIKWTRMGRFVAALRAAYRMARRSDVGLLRHMIYLAEACWLALDFGKRNIEHVHVHFGTNSATVANLTSILSGVPYSFTVHGPEEFDRPNEIALTQKIQGCKFVTAVSSFGRSQLYRWCGYDQWPKVKVVHCGVGSDYLTATLTPPPSNKRFVCVGRLCEQKGQLLLLDAAARLKEEGRDFELLLVGDGEMRDEVERRIETLDLQRHVSITGWQNGEQVKRHMLDGRCMVLASFAEGLPVAIMEALALGRPVLTTTIAGVPELVTSDCGYVIPAGSVDALADAMRRCLDASTAELEAMGNVGAERVRERHDVATQAGILAQAIRGDAT